MAFEHGLLENEILNAVWSIENSGRFGISAREVLEILNSTDAEKRAYTTIKTVMDRLAAKGLLRREKRGKKFFYFSAASKKTIAQAALKKLLSRYFNNDVHLLIKTAEEECLSTCI